MTRTRRARPDLSESWDDMDDEQHDESTIYTEDDERSEMQDSCQEDASSVGRSRRDGRAGRRGSEGARRRSPRWSVEPDLVMPTPMPTPPGAGAGTAAAATKRTATPRIRLNDRSMTSDAGQVNGKGRAKARASTAHFRLNQRSLTSDAGRFGSRLKEEADGEEDEVDEKPVTQRPHPNVLWQSLLRPLLVYSTDIVGIALHNLKPLLAYALLLYILIGGLVFGIGFLTNSVNNALTPICRIPGASYLNLPFCPETTTPELRGPAEFDKLVQAQSQFEDVLASTQVGASLPLDMKRSEASIRDLKHVVQYSTLPSRNELVFEFGGFIDTARQASQDLSRFNSHIGRAVDHILSTNRWTLSTIEGVKNEEEGQGAIRRWVGANLNIFAPFQPVSLSRDLLLDQYLRHTGAVEDQILTLITEAHALLNILDNLDARLDVIAAIATRDGVTIQDSRDELLAHLWTKLGGNRHQTARHEQQLRLLTEVVTYRRLAWAHITGTIVKLQAIRDNLEDLRERVARPEVVGAAVPLEVHIANIDLGIERLEAQREEGRRVEAENHARLLRRAGEGEGRVIDGREL